MILFETRMASRATKVSVRKQWRISKRIPWRKKSVYFVKRFVIICHIKREEYHIRFSDVWLHCLDNVNKRIV